MWVEKWVEQSHLTDVLEGLDKEGCYRELACLSLPFCTTSNWEEPMHKKHLLYAQLIASMCLDPTPER